MRTRFALIGSIGLTLGMLVAGWAAPARAMEFWDDRIQIHGFYETQLRTIARDFSPSDGFDLTQWYNILNVEIEADLVPDGFGPFDLVSAYSRIEVRYDCVWKRACGMFRSVNAFGDRTRRLPERLADGRRAGFRSTGNLFNGDTRFFRDIPREFLPYENRNRPRGAAVLSPLFNIEGIDTLFDSVGADGVFGTPDDPAPFYFSSILEDECDFTFRRTKGSANGVGVQIMGPWRPSCDIDPIGKLADKPNPLSSRDFNSILGATGSGALPLRPAPERRANDASAPDSMARGVYYPNQALARRLREDKFDNFDQNFREAELAWNRGASQQDEKELKELYFDIEMFDSRLWIRAGKQTVVWGKTELFRNQDQWNPQDLALASLPSLEESRIALWGGRFVWHFWDVGPLEDVRAEFVFLYDQFEPTDIGRCGEPYAPNPVCDKTLGLFVHGLTGFGVAGEQRPPNPWDSWKGIEVGGRLEWRWDRYSFALTDYYGFSDFAYQETLFRYSRNVDPVTGRPRKAESSGRCRTGLESDCLRSDNALTEHSVNQQLFSMICATSIGFSALDLTACGQTVFNSPNVVSGLAVSSILSAIVAGGGPSAVPVSGQALFLSLVPALGGGVPLNTAAVSAMTGGPTTPLVPLSFDPNDGMPQLTGVPKFDTLAALGYGLSSVLTDEQEALLGCGPFYGTSCDAQGIDLMNAEASALTQSWPGTEGTFGFDGWDTTDPSLAQPGTVGFQGGPVCTRFERGRTFILPGCRGPGDAGYDPRVDGTTTGPQKLFIGTGSPFQRAQPFTGQAFRSEMAIVSWNALMGLVAFSATAGPLEETNFDPTRPFRDDGCSFKRPYLCGNVQSLFQITGLQRDIVRAGGNGRFGRRDFVWHGGKDIVLRYQKRNIAGFSMDFAEDITKSNIGLEFTWENNALLQDNNQISGLTEVDRYNLTVSVDRPTFVNFLNANRTLFMNAQVFFQYVSGYRGAFTTNGPFNTLAVFTVNTGYLDDRLLPAFSLVYDVRSNSGAFLPQVQYRYSSNFSATFGVAVFAGREEPRDMAISPTSLGNRVGAHAYDDFVENGLTAVRDRDEVFLRIRYTF